MVGRKEEVIYKELIWSNKQGSILIKDITDRKHDVENTNKRTEV
jgi:hypothetical protein